jgi:hypothetical protein
MARRIRGPGISKPTGPIKTQGGPIKKQPSMARMLQSEIKKEIKKRNQGI